MTTATPSRYAATTEVPVSRSRAAIEEMLRQRGATHYATGWDATHDTIQFDLFDQRIRFTLPKIDTTKREFTHNRQGYRRPPSAVQKSVEQADRQRWRALYLVIRAKLEAIEAGIAIFEQEFLSFIVQPNGLTIGDMLIPRLQAGQGVAGLLPGGTEP